MKVTRTWILIADGARARILEQDGPGKGLHAVAGKTFEAEHGATHVIVDDRCGRTFSSIDARRSAIDPGKDPHRALKSDFAKSLADELARAYGQKAYDRIVLIAPPIMLGHLRQALPKVLKTKVLGEIAQDLTKLPDEKVPTHLRNVLAV